MKRKIFITGSNGLLGQKLTDLYLLEPNVELIASGRGENRHIQQTGYEYVSLDITDKASVDRVLDQVKPHVIIHGAAMTHVDQCELHPEDCHRNNVLATQYLVDAAARHQAQFIFVSTDFIFDGKSGPYTETDFPHPLSIYGQSKLDAEQYVQQHVDNWAIARTVLVYGLNTDMSRSNIVLWAKGALEGGQEINVVDDQVRSPTLAEDLAKGCYLIERKMAHGIFNISGKDIMTIYELVQRVANYFGLSMDKVKKIDSQTLSQPAKRPPITGFDLSKSRDILGYEPHSFEEGIALVLEQFEQRKTS
jgi:dTDP-4-dehydrorhamnose reductase